MVLLSHPDQFKTGLRVLILKSRNKDGPSEKRSVVRSTKGVEDFDRVLRELAERAKEGERIYASAGQRCEKSAIREFKRRQLDADYDPDTLEFYLNVNRRWCSCAMLPSSQKEKFWLFDCDTAEQTEAVRLELSEHCSDQIPYEYASKTGTHFIVNPFNRTLLSLATQELILENAQMLWGYF